MEVKILKEVFSKHLNKLSPALKKCYENEELNINDKIIFDVNSAEENLNIYSKNEETSVKIAMKIQGSKSDKAFLVNGKKMINLVNRLEDKDFYMKYNEEDSILEFKQDGDIFLSTKPADIFSSLDDQFNASKLVTKYRLSEFIEILHFAKIFNTENNFGFVELKDKIIAFGQNEWIGFCTTKFEGYFKIPIGILSGLIKYTSLMEGEEIHFYENDCWYFVKDYTNSYMAIRKAEGEIPNVNDVIGKSEAKDSILVGREQLLKVINRLSIPLEKSNKMSFALLGSNILQISSKNISEKIYNKEPILIKRRNSENLVFSINFIRILKILNCFSEEMVKIDVYDNMISIYEKGSIKSFIAFMQDD